VRDSATATRLNYFASGIGMVATDILGPARSNVKPLASVPGNPFVLETSRSASLISDGAIVRATKTGPGTHALRPY